MKVVVLITSLLLHSLIAQADSPSDDPTQLYQVAQCPAIGEDYERMVAKLDTIKAAIKDTGNCKHVTLAVDTLQKLLDEDRQKAIDIVDKSSEAGLSKEDSEFIKKYAEGLTKKVASLSDLFLHSNQCFAEDAPDPLSSLSGIVGEASSLIGSVAGPWGAPIALAGNIIAGFLSGLNEVMNSRAGYDFSKRDQWMSYVQNLCTYHTYREQVESLLDPVGRLSQLRTLQAKLEAQIEKMAANCPECQSIATEFKNSSNLSTDSLRQLVSPAVESANAKNDKPLGSFMLQSLGLRDWVLGEVERITKESKGDWANASGQYVLTRAKDELDDFLIKREAPEFLYYQTSESRNEYQSLVGFVNSEGRALYAEIERKNPGAFSVPTKARGGWGGGVTDPLSYLTSLVLNPIHWELLPANTETEDLNYTWKNFRAESVMGLRRSQTTARVALSFCAFFKHTNQYDRDIRSACSETGFLNLVEQQVKLDAEIAKAGASNPDLDISNLSTYDLNDSREFARSPLDALIKTIDGRGI